MKKLIYIPIAIALSTFILPGTVIAPAYSQYEYSTDADYAKYYDLGMQFYNNNEYTKAIEQFTQGLKIAPTNGPLRNNLAVSYISRGTYFHNVAKNNDDAIENYLEAIYYLKYDLSDGAASSPNASGNLSIASKNLTNAVLNTNNSVDNAGYLLKKAKELRTKGRFRPAVVMYQMALDKSPANAEAYEAIGDMYKVLQNNVKASWAYEKALGIKTNDPLLYVKAGIACDKADKINEAVKYYNKAAELDPKNPEALAALQKTWEDQIKLNPRNAAAHANLGAILQKKGDFDGAMAQYHAAELIEPNNIFVRLNLGTLYQSKGDLKTAIRAYDTILQVEPKNSLAKYYKATALRDAKDYVNAERELNAILQNDPNYTLAKKELVEIAKLKGGGGAEVVNILKELADKEPANAKAQYDAAFEAHSKGNLEVAINYYRKTIAIDPNMADAYANLGAALYAKKQYKEAEQILNRATVLDPANEDTKKILNELKEIQTASKYQDALTLHQQGKVREAITMYEESYKAEPNNAELLTNLGAAYQSIKSYDSAINSYRKSLALDPKSAITHYYLANTLYAKNQIKEAIASYKQAISLDPSNNQYSEGLKSAEEAIVSNMLSEALNAYNTKSYAKAQTIIADALRVNDNNAIAYYYLGLIKEAQNNVNGAIMDYKKATQIDPKLDSAFYALAVALDKTNNTPEAKEAFTKYLQLAGNKTDAFVNYAKARLKQL